MSVTASENQTSAYYEAYYRRRGLDRNDLRSNRGVLFQTLAQEASVVRALATLQLDPSQAKLLDVGCGEGANLFQLLRMQFEPQNIVGVDLQAERIQRAAKVYPNIHWIHGDATCLAFEDGAFDVVYESTMFATITDDRLAQSIAAEMQRVCRVGGYILLVDWWMPKFGDRNHRPLTKKRLRTLFDLTRVMRLEGIHSGALAPPIGRVLSRWFPAAYFAVSTFLPFTVAQGVYVLSKR